MSRGSERWLPISIALLAALIGAYFLFFAHAAERGWKLSVASDRTEGTPWQTFAITAQVTQAGASEPIRLDGWSWSWTADQHDFAGTGPTRSFRSGKLGAHRVTVTATSPGGTRQTAQIDVVVREVPTVTDFKAPPAPPIDPSIKDVPFGFSDIEVEKSAVCVGEPSLIKTTATATNGAPGNLITVIAGTQGSASDFFRLDGEPGMREVAMQLRDPEVPGKYAEEKVYIEIKDCFAPASLLIENTADPILPDRYSFKTRLMKLSRDKVPAPLPEAASYRWDFGDGTTETTTTGDTAHTFPPEAERRGEHFHTYLVTVEALDATGAPIAGNHNSVFFYNLRRQSKDRFGLIELPAHFRDLAELDAHGDKAIPVTLDNIDDTETVHLTDVKLRSLSCDGKTETASSVAVQSIFPTPVIPPGTSLTGTFTVHGAEAASICRVFATVTGTTTPGSLAATGSFAMTTGDAFRKTITDQKKLEVMRQVIQILGTTSFTEEDVHRLEDEGKIPRGVLTDDPTATPPPH